MNPLTPFTQKFKSNKDFRLRQNVKKELNNLIETEKNKNSISTGYELKVIKKSVVNHFKLDAVTNYVCEKYGQDIDAVKTKSRKRELVKVRQEAMFILANAKTEYSLKVIGHYFGGRDHSTVIHSCQAIENEIDTILGYKQEIKAMFLQFDPKFNFIAKKLQYLL